MNLDRTNETRYLYEVYISATLKEKETFKSCIFHFSTLHSRLMGEILRIYVDSLRHIQAFWSDRANWTIFFPKHIRENRAETQ